MFGHGGGGWTDLPRLPRAVMIISFDSAQLSFRLFVAAHSSMCAISAKHDLVLAAGTMRYFVVSVLKDTVCWRHRMQVCCRYNVRCRTQCRALYDTGLYLHDRRALTIKSRTVIVFTKEIVYPVVDIVWYPQSRQFSHQGHVPHRVESLREVEREYSYVLVGRLHRAYSVQYSCDGSSC